MASEWSAPAENSSRRVDPEVDEMTIQRGLSFARIVAVVLLLCGLMYGANLAQIVLFAYRQSPSIVFGELCCVMFTVLYIAVGSRIYDGGHIATAAGAAASFAGAAFAAIWFVYLFLYSGALSVLSVMVAGASALGGLLCLVSLPQMLAVSAARRRLFDE